MKKTVLVAIAFAGLLAACQTIDARIAEISDRLAARCVELQSAVAVVDLVAPENVRSAVGQGRIVFDRFCAKPPRTAAELAMAIGEILQAKQTIDAAKKGA